MTTTATTSAPAATDGVTLLRALDALLPEWLALLAEQGLAEAGRQPDLMAKITALWPRFDTGELARASIELQAHGVCRTCGGWTARPLWAQAAFQGGLTAELYASAGAQTAAVCSSCSPNVSSAPCLAELEDAPTCTLCRGAGLVPNWLFNFFSMPCMADRQLESAEMWFAAPCGGCGGWGKQGPVLAEHQRQRAAAASEGADDDERRARTDFMTFDGERWCFRFDEREVSVNNTVGMRHLHRLVEAPRTAISCLVLSAMENGQPVAASSVAHDEGLTVATRMGHAGLEIDEQAAREYKQRLDELEQEIAEAEAHNDQGRRQMLAHEREGIRAEIRRSITRSGTPRKVADDMERARKAVSNALRRALRAITKQDAALGKYLETALSIGGDCVFTPGDTRS